MVQAKLLSKYKNLRHYFLNKTESGEAFYKSLNYFSAEQVHNNRGAFINQSNKRIIKDIDALISGKNVILNIRTADCLPIFLFNPKENLIAAIHAGFKGLIKDVIGNTVSYMTYFKSKPGDIRAVIGPHIGKCCYEVGEERIRSFQKKQPSNRDIYRKTANKWYLDLALSAYYQLLMAGLVKNNIEVVDICTKCNHEYYSYRRNTTETGRQLNMISLL